MFLYNLGMAKKYRQLLKEKGSRAIINDELFDEILFKVGPGLYSEKRKISTLEYLVSRYPHAIFCSFSAFYYYGMTNVIPDYYYLAIERKSTRIKEGNVKLTFFSQELVDIGKTTIDHHGIKLPIYDQERLLIDLIRFKSHYDPDYYKTIITYYRSHLDAIDTLKLEGYLSIFNNGNFIRKVIFAEVY